jgi:hypothetical protein
MIKFVITPSFYTVDAAGQVNGWSATSPFKKSFPDYHKFALVVGKSGDVAIKTNYEITDETFGGSKAIVINHIGAEMNDSMLHSIVNNPNQYDYVVQILDYMARGYIKVLKDNVEMTQADVAGFSIVP